MTDTGGGGWSTSRRAGGAGPPAAASVATDTAPASSAVEVVAVLRSRGQTLATAESLTGGLVGAAVTSVPGASAVYRGGVISYATVLKVQLLDVDVALLEREGAVHPDVAAQMASGVRAHLDAGWGVATTGVAGPSPQDGHPVGTVYVAVAAADGITVRHLQLVGDRAAIRAASVEAALRLLLAVLAGERDAVASGDSRRVVGPVGEEADPLQANPARDQGA